jgi:hypothetical protein
LPVARRQGSRSRRRDHETALPPLQAVSADISGTPSCSVKDAAISVTGLWLARSNARQRSAVVVLP